MCGLVAIFSYSHSAPPVDQDELLSIREAMVARGPDSGGLWLSSDKRIGLAHRRLAIIDLSETGAQPMATSDGAVRIVFNGEIYNYRELRLDLEAKGYRFRSNSDTEVLLFLYREYGRDMVERLRGMYAIVIWDDRKRGLFLARDPFGIKPLYYADDGSTIRVASQVKALLKSGRIDSGYEPAGHVGFFLWGVVPEPYTLYKGIRSLPAGSTLWVDASVQRQAETFFSFANELARAEKVGVTISSDEMAAQLREALLGSVSRHLIADVPIGVFLSAGLDSTTVAGLVREVGQGEVRTITLGFNEYRGTHDDETLLADLAALHYQTAHQTIWMSRQDFQDEFEHILTAMDQPSTDGVNTYFVSQAAAAVGLKVAISGVGGDELFGGYASFMKIPFLVNALYPLRHCSFIGKGARIILAPVLKHFTSPKYAGLLEYGGTYSGAYLLRRGMFMPWELNSLLDGDLIRDGWGELQTILHLEETVRGIDSGYLKVAALESAWYMRNQLLRDADWASMAHSLEIRTPLVDIDLFRSVMSFVAAGRVPGKLDMALVLRKPLPDQILYRKKSGFSIPVRQWLSAEQPQSKCDRGLRGWAKLIYKRSLGL